MVANILPIDPPSCRPWWWGQKVKIQLFQSMVMLHIKLKGMKNAAACKPIFCPYTHPQPLGWGQRSKHFFLVNIVMLHIKLMGMEHRAPSKYIFCPNTPLTPGMGSKQLLKVVMLHIKLKGMEYRAQCKHIFSPYTHPQPLGEVKRSKHFFFLK